MSDLGMDSMLQPSGMSSTPTRPLDEGLQEVDGLAGVEESEDLGGTVQLRRCPHRRRRQGRRLVGVRGVRRRWPDLARSRQRPHRRSPAWSGELQARGGGRCVGGELHLVGNLGRDAYRFRRRDALYRGMVVENIILQSVAE
jgi:hypothetical protein